MIKWWLLLSVLSLGVFDLFPEESEPPKSERTDEEREAFQRDVGAWVDVNRWKTPDIPDFDTTEDYLDWIHQLNDERRDEIKEAYEEYMYYHPDERPPEDQAYRYP